MGHIATSNTVVTRGSLGRFISQIELGEQGMLDDMASDGADLARALAPKGHKPDKRTPRIVDSITHEVRGNAAIWGSSARHAGFQEDGTGRHPIPGNVEFFWEKYWRMWRPGDNVIDHPGNPATHYLLYSYQAIMARWMEYARRHLPQ